MTVVDWYCLKINKTVEEFDMFDKYIVDVINAWEKDKKDNFKQK